MTECTCAAGCVRVLIQRNVNGSNAFNRSWAEFKVGFNDSRGNYWLGNDRLHQLTANDRYKLRFDLQIRSNLSWIYAEYSSFVVSSEADNYRMRVSGYSGNAGDWFSYTNGYEFTTYDRDNDQWGTNCAVENVGGFWYKDCAWASVNAMKRSGYDNFEWHSLQLQSTLMWLIC